MIISETYREKKILSKYREYTDKTRASGNISQRPPVQNLSGHIYYSNTLNA
jgi:hypothetical protein